MTYLHISIQIFEFTFLHFFNTTIKMSLCYIKVISISVSCDINTKKLQFTDLLNVL